MSGFISYARSDLMLLEQFRTTLKPLEQHARWQFWYDRDGIKAGDDFNKKIEPAIKNANVFLYLVSPRFLASDYIRDTEQPAIEARAASDPGSVLILPVWLKPCLETMIKGSRQLMPHHPTTGRPRAITKWGNRDEAFAQTLQEIEEVLVYNKIITPIPSRI